MEPSLNPKNTTRSFWWEIADGPIGVERSVLCKLHPLIGYDVLCYVAFVSCGDSDHYSTEQNRTRDEIVDTAQGPVIQWRRDA